MNIKIRKYVAKVAEFKEHEDGTISKEVREITLKGKRYSPAAVLKQIPREAKLLESGWKETAYDVDDDKLEKFLTENGKPVSAVNAE